jgi:two-component system invasion response regulator UvrY
MGGLALSSKILEKYPASKIIVLSAHFHDPLPTQLLTAGAKGYLSKGSTLEDMIAAITAVHNGKVYLGPEISNQLALHNLLKRKSPLKELSP